MKPIFEVWWDLAIIKLKANLLLGLGLLGFDKLRAEMIAGKSFIEMQREFSVEDNIRLDNYYKGATISDLSRLEIELALIPSLPSEVAVVCTLVNRT